ncbi:MAG: 30S ribosomal protein S4 [Gemmataceae bacterium]
MARNTDPVCKQCRREGIKLYLKGAKCDTKCILDRRQGVLPGMHGYRRPKLSEYGVRLREKQKLKRFYGVMERQFRRYFAIATRSPANTGEQLISIMERRLDNVVHRLGWAPSRAAARQIVSHGHVTLNGRACDIAGLLVKQGDVIAVKQRPRGLAMVRLALSENPPPLPEYLEMTGTEPPTARVSRLPTRGDVDPRISEVREQLIIELTNR